MKTYGRFPSRRDALAAGKTEHEGITWFNLFHFSDDSWDYACAYRHLTLQGRTKQVMYLKSKKTGNWYQERNKK